MVFSLGEPGLFHVNRSALRMVLEESGIARLRVNSNACQREEKPVLV
jgi:hypothetical protein